MSLVSRKVLRAVAGRSLGGGLADAVADLRLVRQGWHWGRHRLVPRSAEPFVEPRESRPFPTDWARTPAAVVAREGLLRAGLGPLVRHEIRPAISGLDVLARVKPPVVIVANHASHIDTALLLTSLPPEWQRRTAVAAAADYFFDTWWRATGSALLVGAFPIDRRGGERTSTPSELLAAGWNVVVFPEGTRSPDGWTRRFQPGAAYLASSAGVPVLPVAIRGSFAAMPRGKGWPVPGRPTVTLRFGDPVHPRPGEAARELAPRIEAAVASLLDEDTTTWWQARRRAAVGATPPSSGPDVSRWRRVWAATEPPRVSRRAPVWPD